MRRFRSKESVAERNFLCKEMLHIPLLSEVRKRSERNEGNGGMNIRGHCLKYERERTERQRSERVSGF
jgi:hypothetical protein